MKIFKNIFIFMISIFVLQFTFNANANIDVKEKRAKSKLEQSNKAALNFIKMTAKMYESLIEVHPEDTRAYLQLINLLVPQLFYSTLEEYQKAKSFYFELKPYYKALQKLDPTYKNTVLDKVYWGPSSCNKMGDRWICTKDLREFGINVNFLNGKKRKPIKKLSSSSNVIPDKK